MLFEHSGAVWRGHLLVYESAPWVQLDKNQLAQRTRVSNLAVLSEKPYYEILKLSFMPLGDIEVGCRGNLPVCKNTQRGRLHKSQHF